ncbi:MAG: 50S ribosomal protein L18 [Hyphomicrobiaceae bacterium]|nr:50S ribosomal protein L18 [Hyphomicrobiaceae bacterium]
MGTRIEALRRRSLRVRRTLKARANGRPRLSVHRTGNNIYAQVIDDVTGTTLAAASSLDKELRGQLKSNNTAAAEAVGKLVGERAVKAGITDVVFDRGGYLFHGRVKALADSAREAGLKF